MSRTQRVVQRHRERLWQHWSSTEGAYEWSSTENRLIANYFNGIDRAYIALFLAIVGITNRWTHAQKHGESLVVLCACSIWGYILRDL